jgi:hypothetical protein
MADKILLLTVKDIIFDPTKAWETIYSENRPLGKIRNGFLLPLIILVSASAVAGSLMFTHPELSPVYSVFIGLKCFVLFYVSIYATAYLLKEITHALDLSRDFGISFRLVAYSVVPFLFCQVLSRLFESLLFVNVLSLYSLYVFWTGTERLLTPPAYKKLPLLIATVVTFAVIFVVTNLLLTLLFDRIFQAFVA